jgi:rhodanese-related sulfurtransferase
MSEPITRGEVEAAIADAVTIVEALPAPYFEDGHLPGAANLPHDSDDRTISAVLPDRNRTVVVYCANRACANSGVLGRRLDQLGYADVRVYEGGKEDWLEAGLALEAEVTAEAVNH